MLSIIRRAFAAGEAEATPCARSAHNPTVEDGLALIDAADPLRQQGGEVERLREALADLVRECEGHDRRIAEIIGKPVGWRDTYLDRARRALERVEEGE